MSTDLALALELADAADAISLPGFRSGLAVEQKPDLTPVTEADLVEAELRRLLGEVRPLRPPVSRARRGRVRRPGASLDPGDRGGDRRPLLRLRRPQPARFGTALTSNGLLHEDVLAALAAITTG